MKMKKKEKTYSKKTGSPQMKKKPGHSKSEKKSADPDYKTGSTLDYAKRQEQQKSFSKKQLEKHFFKDGRYTD
jgi:hypothetical protein